MKILKSISFAICKKHGPYVLSFAAFSFALLGCLALGILVLFAIFTSPFQHELKYSQVMINRIIIAQTIGTNGFSPFLGYIADVEGSWVLSVIAFTGYLVGFNCAMYAYKNSLDYTYMVFSFFCIGVAHGSLLFSCLLTCAKSFGRYYKTLSISTPNVIVGISGILEVQFIQRVLMNDNHDSVPSKIFTKLFSFVPSAAGFTSTGNNKDDFLIVFKFFVIALCTACVFSYIASLMADYIDLFEEEVEHTEIEPFNYQASPLLTGGAVVYNSHLTPNIFMSPRSFYITDEGPTIDEELQLSVFSDREYGNTSISNPYKVKVFNFFTDPIMYPLLVGFLFSIGSVELFLANLGSILESLGQGAETGAQLSLHSIASTVMRILIMIGTDYISSTGGENDDEYGDVNNFNNNNSNTGTPNNRQNIYNSTTGFEGEMILPINSTETITERPVDNEFDENSMLLGSPSNEPMTSSSLSLNRKKSKLELAMKKSFFQFRPVSRLTIISWIILSCGIGHLFLSSSIHASQYVSLIVILNGFLNAALFTLFPAIIAFIWGLDVLGSTWGLFSSMPVFASFFYNPIYANDYETHCSNINYVETINKSNIHQSLLNVLTDGTLSPPADDDFSGTLNIICSTYTFFITGVTMIISAITIYCLRYRYIKRANEFF
ncbi:hypothetical protein B5S28_g582 [[Candida] boidinii]|nr:hypothetical protein B5S28_g582 [[Candida] boidinii]OWB61743.1 hypothetical protein B5S29_g2646 [[Candida] boidinii]OWB80510.1 hypothetical protein B5S32_g4793 [[Candida] boidinii]